jgi:hypothetical protein
LSELEPRVSNLEGSMKVVNDRTVRNEKSIDSLWKAYDGTKDTLSAMAWKLFVMLSGTIGLILYQIIANKGD